MVISLTTAMPAAVASDGGGGGDRLLIIIVVVLVVGLIMHRVVGPLLRWVLHLVEWLADTSIKIGVTLIAAGAAIAVIAVLYLISAAHGSGA